MERKVVAGVLNMAKVQSSLVDSLNCSQYFAVLLACNHVRFGLVRTVGVNDRMQVSLAGGPAYRFADSMYSRSIYTSLHCTTQFAPRQIPLRHITQRNVSREYVTCHRQHCIMSHNFRAQSPGIPTPSVIRVLCLFQHVL